MGQAFFSLSINGAGMLIYGSYMKKSEDIIHQSVMTAMLDTAAALLAGFAILPAVFAFGIAPESGPPSCSSPCPASSSRCPAGAFLRFVLCSVLCRHHLPHQHAGGGQ